MSNKIKVFCGKCGYKNKYGHEVTNKLMEHGSYFCKNCKVRLYTINGDLKPIKPKEMNSQIVEPLFDLDNATITDPLLIEALMYQKLQRDFDKRIEKLNQDKRQKIQSKIDYKPKISIAMAVYNTRKFIGKAIKSVCKQNYTNWELIIVDDYSTDDSLKTIYQQLSANCVSNNQYKVIKHVTNCGYGKTLKQAIESGTGELVAIIDSDDALSREDAFDIMVEAHRLYPDSALIYSTYWACHNETQKKLIKYIAPFPKGKNLFDVMKTGTLKKYRASHLKIFKRSAYNNSPGLDPNLRKAVDKDLTLKIEETRFKNNNFVGALKFINIPLYFHRKHPNSLTESWGKQKQEYMEKVKRDKARIIWATKLRRGIELTEKEERQMKKYDHEKD